MLAFSMYAGAVTSLFSVSTTALVTGHTLCDAPKLSSAAAVLRHCQWSVFLCPKLAQPMQVRCTPRQLASQNVECLDASTDVGVNAAGWSIKSKT